MPSHIMIGMRDNRGGSMKPQNTMLVLAIFVVFALTGAVSINIVEPLNNTNYIYGTQKLNYTFTNTTQTDECYYVVDGITTTTTKTRLGGYYIDDSGLENDGIPQSMWNISSGSAVGSSFARFNGYKSFVNITNQTYWTPPSFTFEAWILPNTTTGDQYLYSVSIPYYTFDVYLSGDDIKLSNVNNYPSYDILTLPNVIGYGFWQHVAVTFNDADNNASIYINGSLRASKIMSVEVPTMNEDLALGRNNYLGGSGYYNGSMDEVRISNKARAMAELKGVLATVTPYTTDANTMGLYHFEYSSNIKKCYHTNTTFTKNELGLFNVVVNINDTAGSGYSSTINISTDANYEINATNNDTTAPLQNFTALFYNSTFSVSKTAVGYHIFTNWSELPHGEIKINLSLTGYEKRQIVVNVTNETLTFNNSYVLEPISFNFYIYDETTQVALNTSRVNIYNSTNNISYFNVTTISANFSTIPHGAVTIELINESYENRYYYLTIEQYTSVNKNLYMLKTSDGGFVSFFVGTVDASGTVLPISYALVSVNKKYGATYYEVSSRQTDNTGIASMFLSRTTTYRVDYSATGYNSATQYITPSETGYSIYLNSTSGVNITFDYVFKNVTFSVAPKILYDNDTSIIFTVADGSGSLEYYGFNVTWNGTTLYYNQVSGIATGGTLTANVNLSNATGMPVYIKAWFKKSGYDVYIWYDTKYVLDHNLLNEIPGTVARTLKDAVAQIPLVARMVIVIFLLMFFVIGFGKVGVGATGVGVFVLVFLGFMTAVNWFTGVEYWIPLYILMILTVLSIYILQSRW